MSQSISASKKVNEKKKKNLNDFKKKQSYTVKTSKIMTVGSNSVAWRDHLKELIRPTFGDMVYEFLKEDYTEDYDDTDVDQFEPVDPHNLT